MLFLTLALVSQFLSLVLAIFSWALVWPFCSDLGAFDFSFSFGPFPWFGSDWGCCPGFLCGLSFGFGSGSVLLNAFVGFCAVPGPLLGTGVCSGPCIDSGANSCLLGVCVLVLVGFSFDYFFYTTAFFTHSITFRPHVFSLIFLHYHFFWIFWCFSLFRFIYTNMFLSISF